MSKKLVSLFLAAVLICAAAAVLAEDGAITVTDMAGREVKLNGVPQRVVVMMPSDCEILYAIGAQDCIVAAGTDCNYPEAVADVRKVGYGYYTNVEEVLALEPDAVILTMMAHSADVVNKLAEKVPVIVTDAQTIDDTCKCIAMLGKVMGRETEAAQVIDDMKARIAAVAAKAPAEGKTVYFESTPMEFGYGLYSAGKNNFMDEIGTICGLKNIFGDVDNSWPVVSEEDVIKADPDYIVTIDSNGMGDADAVGVIKARESWQQMTALKEGHVLVVSNDAFTRPGPRLADAAEQLYALIYEADEAAVPAA